MTRSTSALRGTQMSCSGTERGRGKSWADLKQKSLREGIINQQPIVWKRERTQKGRIWQMKPRHADLQAKREDFVPRAVPEQAWLALFIRQHQMLQHFLSVHPRHPVYLKNPNNISVKQTFWERERDVWICRFPELPLGLGRSANKAEWWLIHYIRRLMGNQRFWRDRM